MLVAFVVVVVVVVGQSHYLISVDKMNSVNSTSSCSGHKLIFPPNIVKETCMQMKAVKTDTQLKRKSLMFKNSPN